MGDPKRSRRAYEAPTHPWKGERIKNEDEYVRKYGLKNKREFWKAESKLRDHRAQARNYLPLIQRGDPQGKKEADQLLSKLNRLGMLQEEATLGDVLALDVDAVLSRRLQTITFLKGLAATPTQARQFIIHGHIAIGGRRVDVPGYIVRREEEQAIEYAPSSPLRHEAHPLRRGASGAPEPGPEPEAEPDVEAEAEADDEAEDEAEAEAEGEEDAEAEEATEDSDEETEEPAEEAEEPDEPEGADEAEAVDEADEPEEAEAAEEAEQPKEGAE